MWHVNEPQFLAKSNIQMKALKQMAPHTLQLACANIFVKEVRNKSTINSYPYMHKNWHINEQREC